MNDCEIIFLGGIHGAGKGTVSEYMCDKLGLHYLSASKLIKWGEVNKDKTNKTVSNIPSMQERLVNALFNFCVDGKKYLLDGHFCLLDSHSNPVKINLQVFKQINPKILFVIEEDANTIHQRLKERDGKQYDLEIINALQKLELEYAETVAKELNINLYKISSNLSNVAVKLKGIL